MRNHHSLFLEQHVPSASRSGRRTDSVGDLPLRSPRTSQSDVSETLISPISPMSPAVIGTASLWNGFPGLTPRVIQVSRVDSARPQRVTRGARSTSQSALLLRRQIASHRKHSGSGNHTQPQPGLSLEWNSPAIHFLASGILLLSVLVICKDLTGTSCSLDVCADRIPDLTLELNAQLVEPVKIVLIILLAIASVGFHRRRLNPHPSYPQPASPDDVLPCDDSIYSPMTPMRVHLLYDEEDMLEKSESVEEGAPRSAPLVTPPPPAYGLWRCSVRANPNLLHWERVGNGKQLSPVEDEMVQTGAADGRSGSLRPPSYTSDHYGHLVVDANMDIVGSTTPYVEDDPWLSRRQSVAVDEVGRMLRAYS